MFHPAGEFEIEGAQRLEQSVRLTSSGCWFAEGLEPAEESGSGEEEAHSLLPFFLHRLDQG